MKTPNNQFLLICQSNNWKVIDGISNFSISKNISYDTQFGMGGIYLPSSINCPSTFNFSFDRSFIACDFIFSYTGACVNEFKFYDSEFIYNLCNVFLDAYSASFSVGDLPKINTKFVSYNHDYNNKSYSFISQNPPIAINSIEERENSIKETIDIPKLNSIYLSGDANSSIVNNLQNIYSFEYSMNIQRQPFYSIGCYCPNVICSILPITINLTVNSKHKYSSSVMAYNAVPFIPQSTQPNSCFNILVSGKNYIMDYPINRAKLMNTEIVSSTQDVLDIKRTYIGYYGL
jgi:hypothetical protein